MIEEYTLILKHEAIMDDGEIIKIGPPLCITHAFDRRFVGSPIVLNEMMDRLKAELLRRQSEWEGESNA